MVPRDQRGADEDQDRAQDDGAEDADHQRALLQFRADRESVKISRKTKMLSIASAFSTT